MNFVDLVYGGGNGRQNTCIPEAVFVYYSQFDINLSAKHCVLFNVFIKFWAD